VSDRPILFVDRSLGKSVGYLLRDAGAIVELHDDHFPQTELDKTWIPNVSGRGWVILTKDKNIRRPRGEREHVLLARARVFTLASGNMRGQDMAAAFIEHLAEIERIAVKQTPPFVYVVAAGVLRQLLPEPTPSPTPQNDEEKPSES
jgi:hypothetical protein